MFNFKNFFAGVLSVAALATLGAPALADINVTGTETDTATYQLCVGSAAVVDADFVIDIVGTNGTPIALANGDTLTLNIPYAWDLSDQVDQECFDEAINLNPGGFLVTLDDSEVLALGANQYLTLNVLNGTIPNITTISGSGVLSYEFTVGGLLDEVRYINETVSVSFNAGFNFPTSSVQLDPIINPNL